MIRRSLFVLLLAVAILASPLAQARRRAVTGRAYSVIRIGALFSLTGDGASLVMTNQ